jgi:phosphoglycolate phosphatase
MEPDKHNMGSPYRNVIFDLNGTLIDSRPGILAGIRHALAQLGHELPNKCSLDWAIGPPLEEVMARLLEPFGDNRICQAVSHYHDHYGGVGLFFARPYVGISRLLGGMRNAGQSLFVGTRKLAPLATTVLEHFSLAEHFAGIYGAEADGRFSSKTDLIGQILRERRLDPKATVVVGDREHDVISARANGVNVICVTYGYGTVAELHAAGAEVLCDTPSRLRELVERRGPQSTLR